MSNWYYLNLNVYDDINSTHPKMSFCSGIDSTFLYKKNKEYYFKSNLSNEIYILKEKKNFGYISLSMKNMNKKGQRKINFKCIINSELDMETAVNLKLKKIINFLLKKIHGNIDIKEYIINYIQTKYSN